MYWYGLSSTESPGRSGFIPPFQAQRGDVHTVLVDGRIVKLDHRLVGVDLPGARRKVEATVEHLRSTLGEEAWQKGMNPDVPETKILDNPYTYTDYASGATHGQPAQG